MKEEPEIAENNMGVLVGKLLAEKRAGIRPDDVFTVFRSDT